MAQTLPPGGKDVYTTKINEPGSPGYGQTGFRRWIWSAEEYLALAGRVAFGWYSTLAFDVWVANGGTPLQVIDTFGNFVGGGGGVLLQATPPVTQQVGSFWVDGWGRVASLVVTGVEGTNLLDVTDVDAISALTMNPDGNLFYKPKGEDLQRQFDFENNGTAALHGDGASNLLRFRSSFWNTSGFPPVWDEHRFNASLWASGSVFNVKTWRGDEAVDQLFQFDGYGSFYAPSSVNAPIIRADDLWSASVGFLTSHEPIRMPDPIDLADGATKGWVEAQLGGTGPFVQLQAATPGTEQTGHSNITGTAAAAAFAATQPGETTYLDWSGIHWMDSPPTYSAALTSDGYRWQSGAGLFAFNRTDGLHIKDTSFGSSLAYLAPDGSSFSLATIADGPRILIAPDSIYMTQFTGGNFALSSYSLGPGAAFREYSFPYAPVPVWAERLEGQTATVPTITWEFGHDAGAVYAKGMDESTFAPNGFLLAREGFGEGGLFVGKPAFFSFGEVRPYRITLARAFVEPSSSIGVYRDEVSGDVKLEMQDANDPPLLARLDPVNGLHLAQAEGSIPSQTMDLTQESLTILNGVGSVGVELFAGMYGADDVVIRARQIGVSPESGFWLSREALTGRGRLTLSRSVTGAASNLDGGKLKIGHVFPVLHQFVAGQEDTGRYRVRAWTDGSLNADGFDLGWTSGGTPSFDLFSGADPNGAIHLGFDGAGYGIFAFNAPGTLFPSISYDSAHGASWTFLGDTFAAGRWTGGGISMLNEFGLWLADDYVAMTRSSTLGPSSIELNYATEGWRTYLDIDATAGQRVRMAEGGGAVLALLDTFGGGVVESGGRLFLTDVAGTSSADLRQGQLSLAETVYGGNATLTTQSLTVAVGDILFSLDLSGPILEFSDVGTSGLVGIQPSGTLYVQSGGNTLQLAPTYLSIGGNQIITTQQAAVANPTGGAVVDTECRAALAALLARVRTHGLIDT